MPKTDIDYSKTIIYRIVCNDLSVKEVYVGHTTNFSSRKRGHKIDCCNENRKNHNSKIYKTIRENGGFDNWSMIEIEKFPCNDVNEATARERFWYERSNSSLNTYVPNRSEKERKKQYREENAEQLKEKSKIYYEENADKIKEYNKQYHEQNKEQINARRRELRKIKKEQANTEEPMEQPLEANN